MKNLTVKSSFYSNILFLLRPFNLIHRLYYKKTTPNLIIP